jgi:hypothetical protein
VRITNFPPNSATKINRQPLTILFCRRARLYLGKETKSIVDDLIIVFHCFFTFFNLFSLFIIKEMCKKVVFKNKILNWLFPIIKIFPCCWRLNWCSDCIYHITFIFLISGPSGRIGESEGVGQDTGGGGPAEARGNHQTEG